MKGHNLWSDTVYQPLLWERGDIYISRLAPGKDRIHMEWLPVGGETAVYLRKREEADFVCVGSTAGAEFDMTGLDANCDYAFYLTSGEKKSTVRLARTGEAVGTVVNYLHPEDPYYAFSGQYLCSPSLLRLPDGGLLASMDLFGYSTPQNLTLVFRSDDGKTWHHLSELMPCFWGKLFAHKGEVYMLACSTEYGDLLIGKSTDGGKTFCAPVTLLRGSNGKAGNCGVHKNPQPLFRHKGRLYGTLEWGAWANKEFCHAAMVMSCDENTDLLDPESWHFTPPVKFDHFTPELRELPKITQTIEGTLALSPEGELLNIMRFGMHGKVLAYLVNTEDPDAPLIFHRLIDMPTTTTKFTIKQDPVTGRYYSIICRIHEGEGNQRRNLLSLVASTDLRSWETLCDLIDFRHCDGDMHGFQYVDFIMEGEDILWLCRTAMNEPHNYHDANYSTFHRLCNFRSL